MLRTIARFGIAAFLASTSSVVLGSQALPGKAWHRQVDAIAALTVRIGGDDVRCQSGIIVGWRDATVFVLTAQSALLSDVEPAFRLRSPSEERSNGKTALVRKARMIDQGDGLVALAIDDAAFAKWVASTIRFDVLGDDASAMRQDQIYYSSCEQAERKAPTLLPIMRVQNTHFAFQGGDIPVESRDAYLGAPLVQVFGDNLLVIGMISNVAERSDALPMGPALQRLTAWGASVAMAPPSVKRDCSYRVAVVNAARMGDPLLFASRGGETKEVTVETAAGCTWTAFGDGAPWIAVSARAAGQESNGSYVGPGAAIVRSTQGTGCDGPYRRSSIHVAGKVIRVAQDNTSC